MYKNLRLRNDRVAKVMKKFPDKKSFASKLNRLIDETTDQPSPNEAGVLEQLRHVKRVSGVLVLNEFLKKLLTGEIDLEDFRNGSMVRVEPDGSLSIFYKKVMEGDKPFYKRQFYIPTTIFEDGGFTQNLDRRVQDETKLN